MALATATTQNGVPTGKSPAFVNPYQVAKNPYADVANPYLSSAYTQSIKDRYSSMSDAALASPETKAQAAAQRNKLAGMGVIGGKSYDVSQQSYINQLKSKYDTEMQNDLRSAGEKGMEFASDLGIRGGEWNANTAIESGKYANELPYMQQKYGLGEQQLESGAITNAELAGEQSLAKGLGFSDIAQMKAYATANPEGYKALQNKYYNSGAGRTGGVGAPSKTIQFAGRTVVQSPDGKLMNEDGTPFIMPRMTM